jgi:hypothetical protein
LRGTQVAALFYTLCETAKLAGVDPHAYLIQALYTPIAEPGAATYPEDLLVSTPKTWAAIEGSLSDQKEPVHRRGADPPRRRRTGHILGPIMAPTGDV